MIMKFNPEIGDTVRVCYDGKSGRAVKGVVLNKNSSAIQVEFKEWAGNDNMVKCWFSRITKESFGGYLEAQHSLMKALFDLPGDWYSVYQNTVEVKNETASN
jgi:hypothetical protein